MAEAQIIDMFTRRPIPETGGSGVATTYAAAEQIKADFVEMARKGAANLDSDDEEWFVSTFKDFYLSEFMDCLRGIEEADTVADLDYFMQRVQDQIKEWPDLVRT